MTETIFGAFDLETEKWKPNQEIIPFAAGAKLNDGRHFFIDKRQSDSDVCINLLHWMSESDCTEWWAHNGGRFDVLFLYNAARKLRIDQGASLNRQGRPIDWWFQFKGKKKLHCYDSAALVKERLKKIAEDFQLKTKKQFTLEDYEEDLALKSIEFVREGCLTDCDIVLELIQVMREMAQEFGVELGHTAAGTAFRILKKQIEPEEIPRHDGYIKNGIFKKNASIFDGWTSLYKINEQTINAYIGGRCEVIHHKPNYPLIEADINSSYPNAMLNVLPWKYQNTYLGRKARKFFDNGEEGIYQADVTVHICHIPPLPYKLKDSILFPIGTWRGYFSGLELRYALNCGVKVDIKESIIYSKNRPFAGFVQKLYEIKKNSIGGPREFAKLQMNAGGYGKFAQKPGFTKLIVLDSESEVWEEVLKQRDKLSEKQKLNPSVFQKWQPFKDGSLLVHHNKEHSHTHFAIASYITSGGRINHHKGFILSELPAYGDTDGIHAGGVGKLDIGDKLGQFKIVKKEFKAVYYAPKLYEMHFKDESSKYASKGFPVTEETFRRIVQCLPVDVKRIRQLKTQLKESDNIVKFLQQEKLWHGISNKRCPNPDGSTRPWTVQELLADAHLEVRSPVGPA